MWKPEVPKPTACSAVGSLAVYGEEDVTPTVWSVSLNIIAILLDLKYLCFLSYVLVNTDQ